MKPGCYQIGNIQRLPQSGQNQRGPIIGRDELIEVILKMNPAAVPKPKQIIIESTPSTTQVCNRCGKPIRQSIQESAGKKIPTMRSCQAAPSSTLGAYATIEMIQAWMKTGLQYMKTQLTSKMQVLT